jgi:hypothetical protein
MARGDRSKEKFWRRMIGRQAGSGQSVRAWCGRHDLSEASFYWWRRQLVGRDTRARRSRSSRTSRPRFVPVRVSADTGHAPNGGPNCVEIILSGERRVRVFGAVGRKALADVLAVLQAGDAGGMGGANHGVEAEAAAC